VHPSIYKNYLFHVGICLHPFLGFHILVRPFFAGGPGKITTGPKIQSSTLNASDGSGIPKLSNRSFRRPPEAKVGENYDTWVIFVVLGECNDGTF